jgi:hypothetical protein
MLLMISCTVQRLNDICLVVLQECEIRLHNAMINWRADNTSENPRDILSNALKDASRHNTRAMPYQESLTRRINLRRARDRPPEGPTAAELDIPGTSCCNIGESQP